MIDPDPLATRTTAAVASSSSDPAMVMARAEATDVASRVSDPPGLVKTGACVVPDPLRLIDPVAVDVVPPVAVAVPPKVTLPVAVMEERS